MTAASISYPMRITGGIHKSRTLAAPSGTATRPTADRVREALFGILGAAGAIEGARVLDLYAGTGALGLEALSRGATHATLVESSRNALSALRANVKALDLEERTHVVALDVGRVAQRLADMDAFDVVFADPPWVLVDEGDASRALANIVAAGVVRAGGLVVLEHAARSASPSIAGLALDQTRRYGDTALAIFKTAILASPRPEPARTPTE
jgi:16S rRNA (guanine966-N2)-methyltransferase